VKVLHSTHDLKTRCMKEKELFHTWTGRKQKLQRNFTLYIHNEENQEEIRIHQMQILQKENQRDTYGHWNNSCQNKQVRKIFDQENTSINEFVKDFKNLLTEEKEFIWTMKYQSYVQIHKIKLCSKRHKQK
jgi:hypothetical protein